MTKNPTVLIIGTADTKADELSFLKLQVERLDARALIMDVGVLGDPDFTPDVSKHDVAIAAGTTNADIIALGNENDAMQVQATGAAKLTAQMQENGDIDAVLAIGGTMATDLALEVAAALPLGTPKVIVSTVAFSALIPPERISPDLIMMLWAGGLYGLNSVCRSVLRQAAGAAVGAALPVDEQSGAPIIGMTSLGSSTLKYMKRLKPEIEARGFELAVFHTTGLGGLAMEAMAKGRQLAAVMDFSLIEVSNQQFGSVVNSGPKRLEGAAAAGVPQIVAPGGVTLVDLQSWSEPPQRFSDREIYHHNRLVACAKLSVEERREAAEVIAAKVNKASQHTVFIMPRGGIDEWDKEDGPFHSPEGLEIFADTLRESLKKHIKLIELDCHINDAEFSDTALSILDQWIADGVIASPLLSNA